MNVIAQRVDLHIVRLDEAADEIAACRRLLNTGEIDRAGRFIERQHSDRWTVCRARLRQILAGYCGLDAAALEFDTGQNGKPQIAEGACDARVHFNLTHSHLLAAIAVSGIAPVGIDIEYLKPLRNWAGVAARFFSPDEQAQLASVAPDGRREAFYTCWTRKEALIKNTGEGLSARLDEFDVSLGPGVPAAVLADRAQRCDNLPWQMHHFVPEPGYVGAVAIRAAGQVEWREHSITTAAGVIRG
jgi:4'-phosphopantetheinyl transferase